MALTRTAPSGRLGLGAALPCRGDTGAQVFFGLEYTDWRSTTNMDWQPGSDPVEVPDSPQLWRGGGGGSDRHLDIRYYLTPLPPSGPLRLYCAWPARNLPETLTELSADGILDAARRVQQLWAWESSLEPPPPPPELPPGSWFKQRRGPESSASH